MPDQSRIDRGTAFERRVRDVLGARLVAKSGAGWRDKSDVKGSGLRMSCKAETKRTWGRTREQLREAIDMAFGTDQAPALAILEDDGEEIVVMRLSDFARVLTVGGILTPALGRGDRLRESVDTPAMLRDD